MQDSIIHLSHCSEGAFLLAEGVVISAHPTPASELWTSGSNGILERDIRHRLACSSGTGAGVGADRSEWDVDYVLVHSGLLLLLLGAGMGAEAVKREEALVIGGSRGLGH